MDNHSSTIGIIFSYNRAMQLEALLRSFLTHCKDYTDIQLTIIYKTTGDLHEHQYQRIVESYHDQVLISFHRQRNFRSDVIRLLAVLKPGQYRNILFSLAVQAGPRLHKAFRLVDLVDLSGFVLFLVDDALFIRDFNLQESLQMLNKHLDALGFSLRLGKNTTYCYAKDRFQTMPQFAQINPGVLKFRWASAEADFAYPLEISSSIYRIRDILPLLFKINFNNPNILEGRMAARAKEYASKLPSLLCYEQSAAFCNPVNKVQNVFNNRSGLNSEYSNDRLAQLFESGFRININAYEGFIPNSVHQETELLFQHQA